MGYNVGGKTLWRPQVQIPQPSFQKVTYPGFGQQNPQVFAYQKKPYLSTRKIFLMLVLKDLFPKQFHHTLGMLNLN